MACLMVACKAEECKLRVSHLVDTFIRIFKYPRPIPRNEPDSVFVEIQEKLLNLELFVLDCIEYQFVVTHPYRFLLGLLHELSMDCLERNTIPRVDCVIVFTDQSLLQLKKKRVGVKNCLTKFPNRRGIT